MKFLQLLLLFGAIHAQVPQSIQKSKNLPNLSWELEVPVYKSESAVECI